jgi:hypothetical protein
MWAAVERDPEGDIDVEEDRISTVLVCLLAREEYVKLRNYQKQFKTTYCLTLDALFLRS